MSAQVVSALEQRLGPDWTVALAASSADAPRGIDRAGRSTGSMFSTPLVGGSCMRRARGRPAWRALVAAQGGAAAQGDRADGASSCARRSPTTGRSSRAASRKAEPPAAAGRRRTPGSRTRRRRPPSETPRSPLSPQPSRRRWTDATPVGRARSRSPRRRPADARRMRAGRATRRPSPTSTCGSGVRKAARADSRSTVFSPGPGGTWSSNGFVRTEADGRAARIAVREMPVRDIALIAGLSGAFGSDDLTLSGSIGARARPATTPCGPSPQSWQPNSGAGLRTPRPVHAARARRAGGAAE